MKECKKAKILLTKYVDKELEDSVACAFLEEHIKMCKSCRDEYNEMLYIKRLLQEKERKEFKGNFLIDYFLDKIKREKEVTLWEYLGRISLRLIPIPLIANIIILFLYFTSFTFNQSPRYLLEEEEIIMGSLENDNMVSWLLENINGGVK